MARTTRTPRSRDSTAVTRQPLGGRVRAGLRRAVPAYWGAPYVSVVAAGSPAGPVLGGHSTGPTPTAPLRFHLGWANRAARGQPPRRRRLPGGIPWPCRPPTS